MLSKKLAAFLLTVLTLILSAWSGEVSWKQILWPIVTALLGYLGFQGGVDMIKAKKGE